MTHFSHNLLLGLRRPQYTSAPEAYISALSNNLVKVPEELWPGFVSGKKVGAIYKNLSESDTKSVQLIETHPCHGTTENLANWTELLNRAGINFHQAEKSKAAMAIAASFEGSLPQKAKGQTAVPFTQSLSLLQNLRGITRVKGPFEIGLALEKFYSLGYPPEHSGEPLLGVADLWLQATERRKKKSPLLNALDAAVANLLPAWEGQSNSPAIEATTLYGNQNPFGWFYDTWNHLTDEKWDTVLPDRRWTDWASTVLRCALGFGYLWEARWYETISLKILEGPNPAGTTTWEDLLTEVGKRSLIDWVDFGAKPGVRNITGTLKSSLSRVPPLVGELDLQISCGSASEGIGEGLRRIAEDSEACERLERVLRGEVVQELPSPHKNTYEAVTYALRERESSTTRDMDHYGFLKKTANHWLVAEPASEWTAVVATLSIPLSNKTTTVRHLQENLGRLGLRPSTNELIRCLELAGLASGSTDAEGAVTVNSAY
jgi:hypothetical protein